MRRALMLASVLVLACAPLPARARTQTSFDCGEVIKESVQLRNSLINCPKDGLVVGKSKITIDLGGHVIDGRSKGAGILNDEGHTDVVITNGRITDFDEGVLIDASENTIEGLTFEGNGKAIVIDGGRENTIEKNELSGNDDGITVKGEKHIVERNDIFDEAPAVEVDGNGNVVSNNEIVYPAANDKGPALDIEGDDNIVSNNEVLAGETGVEVSGDKNVIERNELEGGSGDGVVVGGELNDVLDNEIEAYGDRAVLVEDAAQTLVADNEIEDCGDEGILVKADETRVENNDIEDSGLDGLLVEADDSRIVDNDADDNGFRSGKGYGIFADGDGIEGSGNDADGNANPKECRPSALCENGSSGGTSPRRG